MQPQNSTARSAPVNPNPTTPNQWAVGSAYTLLGRVDLNAVAVAMALAAYIPFDGSSATVWPSCRTLKQTCRVSNDRLKRALSNLVDVGAITIKRHSRRRSQEYNLMFVTVPDAIHAAAENRTRLVAESEGSKPKPTPQRTLYPASAPPPECSENRNTECSENRNTYIPQSEITSKIKKGGLMADPPRSSCENFASHPPPRSFEDKSTASVPRPSVPKTGLPGKTGKTGKPESEKKNPSTMETGENRIGGDREPEPIPPELCRAAESYSLIVSGRNRSEVAAAYRSASNRDRQTLEMALNALVVGRD